MEATSSIPLGTRVSRVPSKPVERETDGHYALHLWLQHEGKFGGDLALRLSPAEAESLHAQLCYALDGEPAAGCADSGRRTPPCREPVQDRTDTGRTLAAAVHGGDEGR